MQTNKAHCHRNFYSSSAVNCYPLRFIYCTSMGVTKSPSLATVLERSDTSKFGDLTLLSAFQPIYSLSHQSLVGHEALLRAYDPEGRAVSPAQVFQSCSSARERRLLDAVCRTLHVRSFACAHTGPQWLFLNVDASLFGEQHELFDPVQTLIGSVESLGLSPEQIVIELLEGALPVGPQFESWIADLRALGFLIAVDDFGAGHSNFDRVFRLHPHIVKLDRGVIVHAAADATVRRVTGQMISLLHECGSMVLVEGIESAAEAAVALDSDADFVQGYYFGLPSTKIFSRDEPNSSMAQVWSSCDSRARLTRIAYQQRIRPYAEALTEAAIQIEAGRDIREAFTAFLALPDAELCYLLDADGAQIGENMYGAGRITTGPGLKQFEPMSIATGARWSRRPYFRRAVAAPGELQVTRPYPTMQSHRMCVTFSKCFFIRTRKVVICGDMLWRSTVSRPDFGATTADANV